MDHPPAQRRALDSQKEAFEEGGMELGQHLHNVHGDSRTTAQSTKTTSGSTPLRITFSADSKVGVRWLKRNGCGRHAASVAPV